MPRTVVTKTSFLGGEAGPLLEGRSDLAQFQLGARKEQNFITLKGGAATRRPGTRFVTATLNNKPARLIPFVFSYNGGADIYCVEISLAAATTLEFRVIRVSDNSVIIPSTHTLTTDSTINLDEIQFTQSADFLFLVHKSFQPQILQRTALTPTFNLVQYMTLSDLSRQIWQALPYLDVNISGIAIQIDTATVGSGRTITASAPLFTGTSADVDRWFAVKNTTWGFCKITAAIDTQHATVQVYQAFGAATTDSTTWNEGAWSPFRGFPQTICFYNQRLVFGGTNSKPDTFWMSKVGNYLKMGDVEAAFAISNPLNFTLASQKLNQIRWMVGGKKHTIGTSTSEWVGTVTNDGTNLFVQYDEETTHGSVSVQPQRSAYTIPFVQRSGQTIREMVFDFYSDSYQATDLTLFSSQVGSPAVNYDSNGLDMFIKAVAYQESPLTIMWALDTGGRLWGLTRDKQQNIASWHSHVIGGLGDAGSAGVSRGALVKSICVIPSGNGRMDRLWMVVNRIINGSEKYHVEFIDDIKNNDTLYTGFFLTNNGDVVDIRPHLDCASYAETGLTNTTAHNVTAWSGLTRFASDNCYVVAFGVGGVIFNGVLPVDGSGNITLPVKAQSIVAGLHANAEMRLLPMEGGDNPKINLRAVTKIDLATVKLYQTYGLRVGRDRVMTKNGYVDNTTFEAIPFDVSQIPNITTFTGYKEFQVPGNAEIDAAYTLAMTEPWPCTIVAVSSRLVTNEV